MRVNLLKKTVTRDPVCATHENKVVNFCSADFRTLYGTPFLNDATIHFLHETYDGNFTSQEWLFKQ